MNLKQLTDARATLASRDETVDRATKHLAAAANKAEEYDKQLADALLSGNPGYETSIDRIGRMVARADGCRRIAADPRPLANAVTADVSELRSVAQMIQEDGGKCEWLSDLENLDTLPMKIRVGRVREASKKALADLDVLIEKRAAYVRKLTPQELEKGVLLT